MTEVTTGPRSAAALGLPQTEELEEIKVPVTALIRVVQVVPGQIHVKAVYSISAAMRNSGSDRGR